MSSTAWIGWALTGISLLFAVFAFLKNRKPKRIEWWISLDQSLLADPVNNRFADRVAVTVGDDRLTEPRTVVARVKNTGKVGLTTDSMFRPFHVEVGGEGQLHLLRVERLRKGRKEPETLLVETHPPGSRIALPPTLLNAGDALVCQMLIDGAAGAVSIDGEAEDFAVRKAAQGELDDPMAGKLVLTWPLATAYLWFVFLTAFLFNRLVFPPEPQILFP